MDEKMKKIEALKDNKEFKEKLGNVKTVEDVVKAFADEGIEVTEDEIVSAGEFLTEDGKLNEKALENVNGGVWGLVFGIAGVLAGASAARGFFDGLKCRR